MAVQRNTIVIIWIMFLNGIAGYLNAGAVLEFLMPVSHVTGNLTQFAICAAVGNEIRLWQYVVMFLGFLAGATMSGLVFKQKILSFREHPYGLYLIAMGCLLLMQSYLVTSRFWVMFFLSLIMGAQNGMFIFYRGLLVRTTHMTGYITDAGTALATMIKPERAGERPVAFKNFIFYLGSIIIFVLGGLAGVLTHLYGQASAGILTLTVAGTSYIILGMVVVIYRFRMRYLTGFNETTNK
ncbi:MAG TPA: DUF1275 domain-containing protein [Clostridiaceae bacterium]|nr:DUF1275 domain-containing protein [Clostridiaceae bacterium]